MTKPFGTFPSSASSPLDIDCGNRQIVRQAEVGWRRQEIEHQLRPQLPCLFVGRASRLARVRVCGQEPRSRTFVSARHYSSLLQHTFQRNSSSSTSLRSAFFMQAPEGRTPASHELITGCLERCVVYHIAHLATSRCRRKSLGFSMKRCYGGLPFFVRSDSAFASSFLISAEAVNGMRVV